MYPNTRGLFVGDSLLTRVPLVSALGECQRWRSPPSEQASAHCQASS